MKIMAYGNENNPAIMMLHGGGLSWWNYREEAIILSDEYYVVLPVLDGHAEGGEPFSGIENNAEKLIDYINTHLNGKLKALCGLSLGAQIAVEMISRNPDICEYAVIESASLVPSKITEMMIVPVFGLSYGLIKQKWFANIQFQSLRIQESLFEEYYRDTCQIAKADMVAFLRANTAYRLKDSIGHCAAVVRVIVGEKEQKKMIRSAKLLCEALPNGSLEIKKGLYHGEFSLNYPKEYVAELKELMS